MIETPSLPPTGPGLRDRWTDIFRSDIVVHLSLMAAIVLGTFQAYLKDRMVGPLPYVLADGAFAVAVLAWFGAMAIRHTPIRGPGTTPVILLAVILLPAFYVLHPGTTLLVKAAGLRSWSMFPLAALLGLTVVRNAGQLRAYTGLILGLCIVTAVYGLRQYAAGPSVVAQAGPLALQRHGASIFFTIGPSGETAFRAFSTFTYPAPFAAMMVFGILLAAGIVTSRSRPRTMRWLAAAMIPLFFAGMTVSGTRAALVVAVVGLMVLAWFRGMSAAQLVLLPLGAGAFYVATVMTAGRLLGRFQSLLLQEGILWYYIGNPIRIALDALRAHPFGLGLGRTGIGVPFPITSSAPTDYFVFTDGDIGRAAVELGWFGIAVMLLVIFGLVRYVPRASRMLLHTPAEDLALGIGPLLIATAVLILIGSPFATVPHGIIWWFFFGALLRLAMDRADRSAVERG